MNRRERRAAAEQAKAGKAPNAGAIAALYDTARSHLRASRYLDAQLCCQQALARDDHRADTLRTSSDPHIWG